MLRILFVLILIFNWQLSAVAQEVMDQSSPGQGRTAVLAGGGGPTVVATGPGRRLTDVIMNAVPQNRMGAFMLTERGKELVEAGFLESSPKIEKDERFAVQKSRLNKARASQCKTELSSLTTILSEKGGPQILETIMQDAAFAKKHDVLTKSGLFDLSCPVGNLDSIVAKLNSTSTKISQKRLLKDACLNKREFVLQRLPKTPACMMAAKAAKTTGLGFPTLGIAPDPVIYLENIEKVMEAFDAPTPEGSAAGYFIASVVVAIGIYIYDQTQNYTQDANQLGGFIEDRDAWERTENNLRDDVRKLNEASQTCGESIPLCVPAHVDADGGFSDDGKEVFERNGDSSTIDMKESLDNAANNAEVQKNDLQQDINKMDDKYCRQGGSDCDDGAWKPTPATCGGDDACFARVMDRLYGRAREQIGLCEREMALPTPVEPSEVPITQSQGTFSIAEVCKLVPVENACFAAGSPDKDCTVNSSEIDIGKSRMLKRIIFTPCREDDELCELARKKMLADATGSDRPYVHNLICGTVLPARLDEETNQGEIEFNLKDMLPDGQTQACSIFGFRTVCGRERDCLLEHRRFFGNQGPHLIPMTVNRDFLAANPACVGKVPSLLGSGKQVTPAALNEFSEWSEQQVERKSALNKKISETFHAVKKGFENDPFINRLRQNQLASLSQHFSEEGRLSAADYKEKFCD